MNHTEQQFHEAIGQCKTIFVQKLHDYGAAWRILRPASITDQLFIKANRIRSFEVKQTQKIQDSILNEFMGLVNYAIIALIQLEKGVASEIDLTPGQAGKLYEEKAEKALSLMLDKNHDYDEAWRKMRVSSYTDLILVKIFRIKQIEDNQGITTVSEGVDSNYMDILNYAVFAIIKLTEPEESSSVNLLNE